MSVERAAFRFAREVVCISDRRDDLSELINGFASIAVLRTMEVALADPEWLAAVLRDHLEQSAACGGERRTLTDVIAETRGVWPARIPIQSVTEATP